MYKRFKERTRYAGMAELADALDSGSSRSNSVEVQVLLPADESLEFVSGLFCCIETEADELPGN